LGPVVRVAYILSVRFVGAGEGAKVMDPPDYYALRERLIGFLEEQGHGRKGAEEPEALPARPKLWGFLRSFTSGASAR
jgi:hypothetical protein